MKTLLTASLTAALALMTVIPAQAGSGIGMSAGKACFAEIDASLDAASDALLDLRDREPESVALLLPAIQKIREAATSTASNCGKREAFDADCLYITLVELVLEDGSDKGEIDLNELALRANGQHFTSGDLAKMEKKKKNGTWNPSAEYELGLVAILIGLLREVQAHGIDHESALDPIVHAIFAAEELDPEVQSVKTGKKGAGGPYYDLAINKKA